MKQMNEKRAASPAGQDCASECRNPMPANGYEAPKTTLTGVETEGGFCGSIVPDEPDTTQQNITIEAQEVGAMTDYDNPNGTESGWDY